MRLLLLMTLTAVCSFAAADLSGSWIGIAKPVTGPSIDVYLTLRQQDQTITGWFAYGDETRQIPLEKAELHGDQLTFEIHDNPSRLAVFRLTLGDGSLSGEARSGDRAAEVLLSPASPVHRVGNGVTAPVLIYKTDPEFSQEARSAKYQGTVLLYVEVNSYGQPVHIRVLRALGLGLDEKAIEAVKHWKFKPGMKDGRPVTVEAQIEVNFRL